MGRRDYNYGKCGKSYIRIMDDGTTVHHQHHYFGYGFDYYIVVGTPEGISDYVNRIYQLYPPQGYDTRIHWPPDPELMKRGYAPFERLADDLYVLWFSHSSSCE